MRHGECKTVGSKLVAVTVSVDDDGTCLLYTSDAADE